MTSAQVLSHYRDKDQVEKAFMNLKDRLNMRRLRVCHRNVDWKANSLSNTRLNFSFGAETSYGVGKSV